MTGQSLKKEEIAIGLLSVVGLAAGTAAVKFSPVGEGIHKTTTSAGNFLHDQIAPPFLEFGADMLLGTFLVAATILCVAIPAQTIARAFRQRPGGPSRS